MKKTGCIVIVFVSCFFLRAQVSLPERLSFDTASFMLSARVSYDFQSSAIRNEFTNILLRGGTLTDEIKGRSMARHSGINRLGQEFTAEVQLADYSLTPFGQNKYAFFGEFGYQSLLSGVYAEDAFRLAFFGNESYLNDTADFSGSGFQYIDFENFGLGFTHKKTKSYLSINLVNVHNYFQADIRDGTFSMSADSSQAEFSLNARARNTFPPYFSKGLGVAVNICINLELPWRKESLAFFQFRVKNAGFAKIRSVQALAIDTAMTYNGFQMGDFLESGRTSFEGPAWLDTIGLRRDTVSHVVLLPAVIQFGKVLSLEPGLRTQSFFGIKVYPTVSYVPKIYAGVDHKLSEKFHVGASCSYGGFGLFRAGIYASMDGEKCDFGIGTEDIAGCVSQNGFGRMLALNLKCVL